MVTMPMMASGWRQGGRRAALSLRVRRSWLGPACCPGRAGIGDEGAGADQRSSIRGSRML